MIACSVCLFFDCQGLERQDADGDGGNRERLAKGYKLFVLEWIRSEDLKYHMVTIVDNIVMFN